MTDITAGSVAIIARILMVWALGAAPAVPCVEAAEPVPALVSIAAGAFRHRPAGEYLRAGFPDDAPRVAIGIDHPFEIMRDQVSAQAYDACVAAGACGPRFGAAGQAEALPATGVSFADAQDYARWLSDGTGMIWRLPTDAEWAYAAGSRFADDGLGAKTDSANPAQRWLLEYDSVAAGAADRDPVLRPAGGFGANENGINDLAGNVWEWTSTCYSRTRASAAGEVESVTENCGVRVLEGRHRAYVTFFIQDAKGGGCSLGAPPAYLGFRLVRDPARPSPFARLRAWLGA
ncbi:formylglycine-generating enzyme required for sulfatase activity [Hoeflea marina]|uniref:Formylglycine-generating enzyme required for sulfatase activity n=1 Tax=Hoeflea marina TaxID=274592 RepID=A0A317PQB1_9HYPH|nr:SUMF1/EgtB/PvdO family nonheme iron enzyme [Hoeflea marina]PWW00581.1 formylglycine-generating enzyme required for sulfatase activity [Hoeflea marina]